MMKRNTNIFHSWKIPWKEFFLSTPPYRAWKRKIRRQERQLVENLNPIIPLKWLKAASQVRDTWRQDERREHYVLSQELRRLGVTESRAEFAAHILLIRHGSAKLAWRVIEGR
jgi:hypothetical protein